MAYRCPRRRWPLALLAAVLLHIGARPAEAKDCGDEVACVCGDRVVASVKLTADLNNCESDGLILAAGVLDCDGRQIAGPGDRTTAVGVLIRGFHGSGAIAAEVRNCRIRNFGHGVEVDNGVDNVVSGNAIFSNQVGVWMGDGAAGSRIEDNHVRDNRDEGIHVGGGVHDSVVARNTLVNNRRENLYLIDNWGNHVEGNTFDDSDAASILMKRSNDNVIVGNTILQRNILVRGESSGNRFENNEIVSGAFLFDSIEEDDNVWGHPHDNHVEGGIMRKASTCFEFHGAFRNTVSGTAVDTCEHKQEKEAGGVVPYGNDVVVVPIDAGQHTSPGRRRSGSMRFARSATRDDRYSLDVRGVAAIAAVDPLHEDVHCSLTDFGGMILDILLPAGMLEARGKRIRYLDGKGTLGGLRRLDLRPLTDGTWRIKVDGRTKIKGADFPVMTLTCRIGDDSVSYNDFWKETPRGWSLRLP